MSAWFICGTDTEIGKSLVTATLLHAFANKGLRVAGMKPVAAGAVWAGDHWHNDDVALLNSASNVSIRPDLVCPYLLQEAAAPHIAAGLEGITFDLGHIRESLAAIHAQTDITLVEGVGGFRVPLTTKEDTADLAVLLGLPVILVVGMRLGCISHALLTIEAIRVRGLKLAGWVANQIDPAMSHVAANIEALSARIPAPLLGHIPHLVPADPRSALEHLNIELLEF
ncbi:MAG TPA: dethiobiotin synthase [Rhodocyclaceae bacterium]|jgi:dethiobiotin synthetase|nr:dethiobiotin synthase [Rhodocyclaceae bacterium]